MYSWSHVFNNEAYGWDCLNIWVYRLKVVSKKGDVLSRAYGTSIYNTNKYEYTGTEPDTVHICGQTFLGALVHHFRDTGQVLNKQLKPGQVQGHLLWPSNCCLQRSDIELSCWLPRKPGKERSRALLIAHLLLRYTRRNCCSTLYIIMHKWVPPMNKRKAKFASQTQNAVDTFPAALQQKDVHADTCTYTNIAYKATHI